MTKLLDGISGFFKKINSLEIDLSKGSFKKLLSKKQTDPFADDAVLPTGVTKQSFAMPKGLSLDLRMGDVGRYFSGAVFEKAMVTIDKSTLLIIGIAWLVAIVAMGLAFTAVKDTAQLKLKTEVARALDPVLPKIVRLPLTKEQYEPLQARLKKQFPTVNFDITSKPTLRLMSNNPDDFMNWLNAVSYVDSMVSTVRWTLNAFCVGVECPGDGLMQAELTAEAINITQPETAQN
ncbi:MAG: hypothetical protein SFW65_06455 [Alphaproteobacteria bacterium]|nr:hypothetical protein [Alphaproteobacteria bacterium]